MRIKKLTLAVACILFWLGKSGASSANPLSNPNYREGFGKDATGGAGHPICTVISGAASGPGTFDSCFQPGDTAVNKTIIFAVNTVTLPGNRNISSNVTIDGCANGMNGVTVNQTGDAKRGLVISGGSSNVIVRCLNLRGTGTTSSYPAEFDNLALDGDSPTPISDVFIDRITSMQASDGALDITGNVSDITVQRSLFYGNAITMLIKYDTRRNISIHHNVFTRNGERNPQIKGDMQLLDFVNNVLYLNDVPAYPDGSDTSPYGTRVFSCGTGCDSPGNVIANLVNNAYIDPSAAIELLIGPGGGSNAGTYIGGNYCSPVSNCPASPKAAPNEIPAASAVTTLATDRLRSQLLPYVGSPNRTPLDQQRIDDVAAVLPGNSIPPPEPPRGLRDAD
jgi:pectate lyase